MLEPVKHRVDNLYPVIKGLLDDGTSVQVTVTGNSMFPLLRHERDTVLIQPVSFDEMQVGDIVLVKRDNGKFVLHRVYSRTADSFITAGDGQSWIDEGLLSKEHLLARVSRIFRGQRKLTRDSLIWRMAVLFYARRTVLHKVIIKAVVMLFCRKLD